MERSGFHKQESQEDIDSTTLPTLNTPEESIPQTIVPWNRDDDRSRYLGLRASGFTIREALGLIGKAKSTLSLWRQNPTFLQLEERIPELRKTLALEYAGLEFLRNYRLVLEKDYRVLKGSLTRKTTLDDDGNTSTVPQDSQDFQYLLKLRVHYTPQQLQSIEQLFGKGGEGAAVFNWSDYVLTMSRTKEEIKIESHHKPTAELSPISVEELTSEE
jgi:hypothetical protein